MVSSHLLVTCDDIHYWPVLAREQVWFNAGFQEQLVLFELCRYAPSQSCGIYRSWRESVNNALQNA
jgi:dual specificity phosphatase 12